MTITIERTILAQALSEVSPIINPKNPLQILKGIKVETKDNRVKFEASDTQCVIRKYVVADSVDADGAFIVDADFDKYIQKLKCPTVTLEYDNNVLTVKHPKGKAEFSTMPADEYPKSEMPTEGVTELTLPASLLGEYVSKGRVFVGTDDLRPVMKAIFAYIKDGMFGFCATDTHTLATDSTAVDVPADTDVNWYIEQCIFSAIIKGCKNAEQVTVKISPNVVSYKLGSTVIQSLQTKGRYPDFNRVIPKTWEIEGTIDRRDFNDTLNRVSMFSNESQLIKLGVTPTDMTMSADNITTQRFSSESFQHNGCNGELTIGLSANNIARCLSAFDSDEVCLRMSDASRPIVIHQASRPKMSVLCMPMTLNS